MTQLDHFLFSLHKLTIQMNFEEKKFDDLKRNNPTAVDR